MELTYSPPYDFLEGALLLVHKPLQWTSFDVVKKIRYALRKKLRVKKIKVGHAGTLDPLAEGLLVICTGKYTKRIRDVQNLQKEYSGTMTLGVVTDSFDAETPEKNHTSISHINQDLLEEKRQLFLGKIEQVPPVYSALKYGGSPMYKLARKGKTLKVFPRPVEINQFELTEVNLPEISFFVSCSKGTYIRSLVHDYGQELGCGAYLSQLTRTAIGPYKLPDAWSIEKLIEYIQEMPQNLHENDNNS